MSKTLPLTFLPKPTPSMVFPYEFSLGSLHLSSVQVHTSESSLTFFFLHRDLATQQANQVSNIFNIQNLTSLPHLYSYCSVLPTPSLPLMQLNCRRQQSDLPVTIFASRQPMCRLVARVIFINIKSGYHSYHNFHAIYSKSPNPIMVYKTVQGLIQLIPF